MIIYRYLAEVFFFFFTACVFYGGFMAIRARFLMNAVLGLAFSLFGLAGLFFHLGSPFLALMQLLIVKTLAPGFRVAWLVAPEDVVSKLELLKQTADLMTPSLDQHIVYQAYRRGAPAGMTR